MKSFNSKIYLGIIFILLLFLPLIGGTIYSLKHMDEVQNELISVYTKELLLVRDLRHEIMREFASIRGYVLNGSENDLREFRKANQDFHETFLYLKSMIRNPINRDRLEAIGKIERDLFALSGPGIDMKKEGVSITEVNAYFEKYTVPLSGPLNLAINEFVKHVTEAFEQTRLENAQTSQGLIHFLGLASVLTIILSLSTGVLLLKIIRQRKLCDETNELLLKKEKQLSLARKEAVEVVAHDLKNPLATIIMSTELALSHADDPKMTRSSLEMTQRCAESMRRLIDMLLDHSKIESGPLLLEKTKCNLHSILLSQCNRFKPLTENKQIQLVIDIAQDIPLLSFDEGRMEQVLTNILGNAIKFTPTGGSVRVVAENKVDHVYIAVSDTGPGMRPDEIEHIFERYWQVRKTSHQGHGLGLSISKAIVQAHGGEIGVKSNPGEGATFSICLPYDGMKEIGLSQDKGIYHSQLSENERGAT